jgi:hypothetical protein
VESVYPTFLLDRLLSNAAKLLETLRKGVNGGIEGIMLKLFNLPPLPPFLRVEGFVLLSRLFQG